MTEQTIVGFDGAAGDDTSLVVMHRGRDGTWRVESSDGPDADAIARIAAGIVDRAPRPDELPEWERTPVRWGDLIAEWLDAHGAGPFELQQWQRDFLRRLQEHPDPPRSLIAAHIAAAWA